MKKLLIVAVAAVVIVGLQACNQNEAESITKSSPETNIDSVSYCLGLDIGRAMKKQEASEIDPAFLLAGFKAGIADSNILVGEDTTKVILQKFFGEKQKLMAEKAKAEAKAKYAGNIEEGQKFLAENSKKEGVVTLPSGLQYKIIKQGTGAIPKLTDKVTTNYEGRLMNDTIFDSSYKRGEPATFPVQGVIPGWTEALQLMKTGAEWELYIPQELAYGDRDMGSIKPYSTLIFKIELLKIEKEDK